MWLSGEPSKEHNPGPLEALYRHFKPTVFNKERFSLPHHSFVFSGNGGTPRFPRPVRDRDSGGGRSRFLKVA
jgi:hypothetical protein